MRVVAGLAGGRRLKVPPRSTLRPTSERVREAIFASLGSLAMVEEARVLDLFSGTGALGIEALSRGAAAATFVDDDPAAITAIKANLEATGPWAGTHVVRSDAVRFLGTAPDTYDLVLADPPYPFDEWPALLAGLPPSVEVAVLESDAPIDLGTGWEAVRDARRYGDTVVTLARRQR